MTDRTAAARNAAMRQRRKEAGLVRVIKEAWVPAEIADEVRAKIAAILDEYK